LLLPLTCPLARLACAQGVQGEQFLCTALVPGASTGSKGAKTVFDFTAQATVATPLLDISDRQMSFHHS
jgi:hypothetical protein